MTLKTTRGGPVFDGLWNMQHTDGDNFFQIILNGGANSSSKALDSALMLENENWEPLDYWTLTECFMPINLVKWRD